MKTMRKLLPAIAMLLVSVVLMSTASFAWFSMNKTVTATGMKVTATVPTQLLIKGSADAAAYKSAIDFAAAEDSKHYASADPLKLNKLLPVAYKSRSAGTSNPNNNFKKLIKDSYNKVDVNGQVNSAVGILDSSDYEAAVENVDYVMDTFTLNYAGALDPNLANCQLTINLTEKADKKSDIRGAIHVVLVDGSGHPYEFDMGAAAGTPVPSQDTTYTLSGNVTAFTAPNQEIAYTVYIFFDGEDADCKNSNAVNMDQYSFQFVFDLVA